MQRYTYETIIVGREVMPAHGISAGKNYCAFPALHVCEYRKATAKWNRMTFYEIPAEHAGRKYQYPRKNSLRP